VLKGLLKRSLIDSDLMNLGALQLQVTLKQAFFNKIFLMTGILKSEDIHSSQETYADFFGDFSHTTAYFDLDEKMGDHTIFKQCLEII
jgi:hypothetical protein